MHEEGVGTDRVKYEPVTSAGKVTAFKPSAPRTD